MTQHVRKSTKVPFSARNKEACLQLLIHEINHLSIDNDNITILDLYDKYLEYAERHLTISAKTNLYKAKKALLNDTWLLSDDLRKLILSKVSISKLSNNSIHIYMSYIGKMFEFAISEQLMEKNPINRFVKPKMTKKPIVALPLNTFEHIINICNNNQNLTFLKHLLLFLRYTGIRFGEALQIKWSDVSESKLFINGKGKRNRSLPIQKITQIKDILAIIKRDNSSRFVFPYKRNDYSNAFTKLLKDNHIIIDGLFHSIRKLKENEMIFEYSNIKAVADFMGHSYQIQEKHYLETLGAEKLEYLLNVSKN